MAPNLQQPDLVNCFNAITQGKELTVSAPQCEEIIKGLDLKEKDFVRNMLVEALPFYIQNWPGWVRSKDYLEGKLTYMEWYNRFANYIRYKLCAMIKSTTSHDFTLTKNKEVRDQETSTSNDSIKEKDDSQFCLEIKGVPSSVHNLIFLASNENIVIKRHNETSWNDLELNELLNWPYMGVDLKSPEINISRQNKFEDYRYLTLAGDSYKKIPDVEYVDSITPTDTNHEVFSYILLQAYFQEISHLLKNVENSELDRVQEVRAVFNQFLADVNAVNINDKTVCTNAQVSFNIGKSMYIRNKKCADKDSVCINFYEIIIPRVQFLLEKFTANQTGQKSPIFKLTERLNSSGTIDILQFLANIQITYKCLFCNETFVGMNSKERIMAHFKTLHSSEQLLLCVKCKLLFGVKELAGNRWTHNCS